MYKFLLCLRYLRTRYIALASIISVMLGVATMIIVNSVMSGFVVEMHNRLHGILSDITIRSWNYNGFSNPEEHMAKIRQVAGDDVEAMTPIVSLPALLTYEFDGQSHHRPIQLIGIDASTQGEVSDFSKYLQHPDNRAHPTFALHKEGYDVIDHQASEKAKPREEMAFAGWKWRLEWAERAKIQAAKEALRNPQQPLPAPPEPAVIDPFASVDAEEPATVFDPSKHTFDGIVLGIALAVHHRDKEGQDHFMLLPGSDVRLTTATAGDPPKFRTRSFTIVDFYESKMSEYDSQLAFVPIRTLQELRGMIDPETGEGMVNQIQIKLKPGADSQKVCEKLRRAFPPAVFAVQTWKDQQGPLLAAVDMEIAILNILLFLIIAVAGFGILAIFLMIVVEKTRDIGILKSLGASRSGIMGIFLGYGLSLGVIGSGVGLILGLVFVYNINTIADWLGRVTGHQVFDPQIYYFYKIPYCISAWTNTWIVLGALGIAVLASILPALRAAMLHPVEALRYE